MTDTTAAILAIIAGAFLFDLLVAALRWGDS